MTDEFYESFIPEPWTILGLELKPFSLGHYILLGRIKSPLILGGPVGLPDILVAVLFCSKTFKESVSLLDDRSLIHLVHKWAQELTGSNSWAVILGIKKAATIDWTSKIDLFASYMSDGCKMPNIHYQESDAKDVNIPTPQLVKITLQMKLGFRECEIMDRPWSLCLWDFTTIKAIEGVVDVVDQGKVSEAQELANELFYQYNPNLKRN